MSGSLQVIRLSRVARSMKFRVRSNAARSLWGSFRSSASIHSTMDVRRPLGLERSVTASCMSASAVERD